MKLQVRNVIAECQADSGFRERSLEKIRYIMVHRFGWPTRQDWADRDIAPDAIGCAEFYRTNPEARKAVGGEMPYTFVIKHNGGIDQSAEIGEIVPHGRAFNIVALGIGVLGDFQQTPPTDQQIVALVDLCAMLSAFWPHLEIVGHSDLAGAATPGKVCPGELLSVDNIRYRALAINKSLCGQRLLDAGVIF